MPRLSVIIPAYNEGRCIRRALISLRRQTIRDFEIIVKDGGSQDDTVQVARKYADRVVSGPDRSIADARNQGAQHARGDILAFVDADTVVPPKTLERLLQLFDEDRSVVGVSCRKLPIHGDVWDRVLYEFVNLSTLISSWLGIGGAHGNCMLIRREIFSRVGGFNPEIQLAEEQELVRKARRFGRFVFLLDTCVLEDPRRLRRWGRLRLYLTWFLGTLRSFSSSLQRTYEKVW